MGRPKKDRTNDTCTDCGVQSVYLAKGLCGSCYGKAYHKRTNVGEKRKRHLAASKQWNREHREQFNANKNTSYARATGQLVLTPPPESNVALCSDCPFVGALFAKGRCLSCYGKERYRRVYGTDRARRVAAKYGISKEAYTQLAQRANGRCGVCHQARTLVVDHDHATNKVRGLLCNPCNLLLGHIEKGGEAVTLAALTYLKDHNGKP